MGGIELRDGTLFVERNPNELDELAISFSEICDNLGIDHVYVAGYVAILSGRSRATKDIDVLLEPLDENVVTDLVEALESAGFWRPAMPLSSMKEMFDHGDNIWVAHDEQMVPHLEVKEVGDELDRASLRNAIEARIGRSSFPIGPLELQIAYKLSLAAQKDFEDAVHLYTMFEESLSNEELQRWVTRLGIGGEYDRLTTVQWPADTPGTRSREPYRRDSTVGAVYRRTATGCLGRAIEYARRCTVTGGAGR